MLIIGDGAAGVTINQESDFFPGQFFAVPLAVYQVDCAH